MFLPIVLSLVASSLALPALELNNPPVALVNTNKYREIIKYLPISKESLEEKLRIEEEEQRIIDEEKKLIEEEKKIEEANKVIEEENNMIEEEEKKMIEEEKKRLVEEEKVMEEKQKMRIVLSAVPSPPELPPVDTSIFSTFLQAEKFKDSEDASKDARSYNFVWKFPRIIFPGHFLIDNTDVPPKTFEVKVDI